MAQIKVGSEIKDLVTGLIGTVLNIREESIYPLLLSVPENTKRINNDGYNCPEKYWTTFDDVELIEDAQP